MHKPVLIWCSPTFLITYLEKFFDCKLNLNLLIINFTEPNVSIHSISIHYLNYLSYHRSESGQSGWPVGHLELPVNQMCISLAENLKHNQHGENMQCPYRYTHWFFLLLSKYSLTVKSYNVNLQYNNGNVYIVFLMNFKWENLLSKTPKQEENPGWNSVYWQNNHFLFTDATMGPEFELAAHFCTFYTNTYK